LSKVVYERSENWDLVFEFFENINKDFFIFSVCLKDDEFIDNFLKRIFVNLRKIEDSTYQKEKLKGLIL
jgi:hypothetical protein